MSNDTFTALEVARIRELIGPITTALLAGDLPYRAYPNQLAEKAFDIAEALVLEETKRYG